MQTYGWNNAYQNLKHDRGQSLRFGSVKYLFEIMAALYILNIYYKKEAIPLGKDTGVNFDASLGSSLFSVEFRVNVPHGPKGEYIKPNGFDIAVYYVDYTPESGSHTCVTIDSRKSRLCLR